MEEAVTPENVAESAKSRSWAQRLRLAVIPAEAAGAGGGPGLLSVATGVMSIAAVYLYFCGYMFALYYYRGFGLSLESLDVSTQYFFVNSYRVLATAPGIAVFAAMALVVLGYAAGRLRRWLLMVCLIGAFPLLFHVSYGVARRDVEFRRGHPEAFVKFRFKTEDKGADAKASASEELEKAGDAEQLYLLLETKDRIVVFNQPVSSFLPAGVLPAVQVYTLLRSDLKWSLVTTQ